MVSEKNPCPLGQGVCQNKTSDYWVIKFDKQYQEAYNNYLKSIMIESKSITMKPKRTRRKKSND